MLRRCGARFSFGPGSGVNSGVSAMVGNLNLSLEGFSV